MAHSLRRQCTICFHHARGRIDSLLVCSAGTHWQLPPALAKKFGVSADALWRHGKNHISDEYRAAVKIGPFESEDALRKLLAETGASVLDRYNAVYLGHLSRWLVALESGNDDAMIKHGSVMAALLAKVGILTREMLPPGAHQQITQNFFATPDFYSFQRRALKVLRRFPEVLDAWREEFAPQIEAQKLIDAAPDAVATD